MYGLSVIPPGLQIRNELTVAGCDLVVFCSDAGHVEKAWSRAIWRSSPAGWVIV